MAKIKASTKLALYNKQKHEPLTGEEQAEWDEIYAFMQSDLPNINIDEQSVNEAFERFWEQAKQIISATKN